MPTERDGNWKQRALVVDDDEDLLRLMCVLLQDIGIECEPASDGENALALLKSLVFDLLVVDKNLPGIDGVEVARHARVLQPGVVTLLVTGYASEESARAAAIAGVNDYVTKPIDVGYFRARVKELLAKQPEAVGFTPYERPGRAKVPTIPPPPADAVTPPGQWTAWTLGSPAGSGQGAISVLLVEPDTDVRDSLTTILTDIYCEVLAFPNAEQAEPCAERGSFDVLVARPEILSSRSCWLSRRQEHRSPLGSLAILDRRGIDRVIEAIQLGARGALTPPFERSTVASEFTEAVKQLIEERYGN